MTLRLILITIAMAFLSCNPQTDSSEQIGTHETKKAPEIWLSPDTIECLKGGSVEDLRYSEECVDEAFSAVFGPEEIVYVNGDRLRLRASPSLTAPVITFLPIAARVKPLKSKGADWVLVHFERLTIGGNDTSEYYGWVHRDFLSSPSDFQPSTLERKMRISFGSVDSGLCYDLYKDGRVRYTLSYKPELPEDNGIRHYDGTLLRHKDLLWPRIESPDIGSIILIDRPPQLLPEYYYHHEPWLGNPAEACPE